ncbi:hypothetical protein BO70DRAFT_309851, partial [Aspergillus heteromorphus CBS 117.55]
MTPYTKHTVLLTGSTGSLGGCLLYKLTLQLPCPKIYVLIRTTPAIAQSKWHKTMPSHAPAMLQTNKIHYVAGDIRQPNFGIDPGTLRELQEQVTLVIHAAAKIKLDAWVVEAIENNCLPALELASMAGRFRRLRLFVQISTAYVNSFLEDGWVGERLYTTLTVTLDPVPDPEEELTTILTTSTSPNTPLFSSTYTQAKHLMERLLLSRHPTLPLLLLRPTIFGPALRTPYPLYGPEDSTPLRKFATLFFSDLHGTQTWHAASGHTSGANILDEIPVDFVANGCLLHAAALTTGIVHIGSQLYVPITFDDVLELIRKHAPPEVRGLLPKVVFVQDRAVEQSFLAELVKVGTRHWVFDCGRSYWVLGVGGGLGFQACVGEAERLNRWRVEQVVEK